MRRRIARACAFAPVMSLGALAALSVLWTTTAAAAGSAGTLKEWGWWTEVNYVNGVNAPQPENPQDMHVQAGPIVCSTDPTCVPDQAQQSNTGPTQVSAVRYRLASALPDSTDPSTPVANLKLTLAANSPPPPPGGAVPVVACRTANAGGWQADEGGNWSQRAVPVRGGCSNAVASKDGKTFQFAILRGQMVGGDVIDLTITSPPTVSNEPPFQMEFDAPSSADLTLYPAAPSSAGLFSIPSEPVGAMAAAPPSAFSGAPAALAPPPASSAPGGKVATPPLTGGAVGGRLPVGMTGWHLVVLGLLLAVFLAGMAASLLDVQRWLAPAGEEAGVGRFTRVRTAPPVPI